MCCVSVYVTRERGHLRANSCLAWVIKFHDLGAWLLIIENDVLVFYLYQIHTYIVTFFFLVQSIIVHDTRVMESIYNCFGFAICSIYVHKNIGILLLEVSNDHKHFYYVMIYIYKKRVIKKKSATSFIERPKYLVKSSDFSVLWLFYNYYTGDTSFCVAFFYAKNVLQFY